MEIREKRAPYRTTYFAKGILFSFSSSQEKKILFGTKQSSRNLIFAENFSKGGGSR